MKAIDASLEFCGLYLFELAIPVNVGIPLAKSEYGIPTNSCRQKVLKF